MTETISEESRCYLVRTEYEFVKENRVAIGWSWVDFTKCENANQAIEKIGKHIGRAGNQIRRFIEMKKGDVIVVPLYKSVVIGISSGEMLYSLEGEPSDRANQRCVEFFKDENGKPFVIPRALFNEAFQRRLRVMGMTVNDLTEFKAQLVQKISELKSGKVFSLNEKASSEVENLENVFKSTLLHNIQSGKTNLPTGGIGLEELVKELLIADGYAAEILSKQAFIGDADADIKASKSDKFFEINLLVQVKHHQGVTDNWGIRQLKAIREVAQKEDYSDYQLALVTSGAVDAELRKDAEENAIYVIDGKELVDWIFNSISKLSEAIKIKLGIYEVPQIATFS